MKKLALFLLAAALLLAGLGALPVNAAPIDITDKFTDANFRAVVQELIGKKRILDTDVAEVRLLNVNGILEFPTLKGTGSINSLTGLEYFINLESLQCLGNQLTELPELPSNLRMLNCSSNQIAALPTLPSSLEDIFCERNQLTSLPELPASLSTFVCSHNKLAFLPELPSSLWKLDCSNNKLSSLNVTNLSLTWLNCSNNNMKNKSAVKGFIDEWDNTFFKFDPQNKLTIWQWILRYLLFGWLWMR